jgi:hypothetical protein
MIRVKFHDGTSEQTIAAIQEKLHHETIRVVSKPNLYLMKTLDPKLSDSPFTVILRSRQAAKNLRRRLHPEDSSLSLRMTCMVLPVLVLSTRIAQFRY